MQSCLWKYYWQCINCILCIKRFAASCWYFCFVVFVWSHPCDCTAVIYLHYIFALESSNHWQPLNDSFLLTVFVIVLFKHKIISVFCLWSRFVLFVYIKGAQKFLLLPSHWTHGFRRGYRISLRGMRDFEKGKLYIKGKRETFY